MPERDWDDYVQQLSDNDAALMGAFRASTTGLSESTETINRTEVRWQESHHSPTRPRATGTGRPLHRDLVAEAYDTVGPGTR